MIAVIDTNVVVAGLITANPEAPTAVILDGMLRGGFPFLLSVPLLAEYRAVLLRPRLSRLHRLDGHELDSLLSELVRFGILRAPAGAPEPAPDPGDDHVWALLAALEEAILVTGDRLLLEHPPAGSSVVAPADFVTLLAALESP